MPMTRGMESACYVKLADGASAGELRMHLQVSQRLFLKVAGGFGLMADGASAADLRMHLQVTAAVADCQGSWGCVRGATDCTDVPHRAIQHILG